MDVTTAVVCGYDGSQESQHAVDWAAGEADLRGVGLRLVLALSWPPLLLAAGQAVQPQQADDETLRLAHRTVQEATDLVTQQHPGLAVTAVVEQDAAIPVLLREGEQSGLLVVGARGRGGFRRMVLGSVSTAVAEHAACPVVVVHPPAAGEGPPAGPVVAAVDGSAASAAVLAFAVAFAAPRGLPVRAVTAVHLDPLVEALERVSGAGDGSHAADRAADSAALLRRAVAPVSERHPQVEVREETVYGHPVATIAEAAAGATLLVVGAQGHGDLRAALLGSVSRGVLHHVSGPVAVVPHA